MIKGFKFVRLINFLLFPLFLLTLTSCQTAKQHADDVNAAQGDGERLTVGTVQRKINIGMSTADVIEVMGSPNIVSTDDQRREVWVYDKISSTRVYSRSEGGFNTLILGGALLNGGVVGGGAGSGYTSGAGATTTSQKALTVIIKFDDASKVRDFAYRSTQF